MKKGYLRIEIPGRRETPAKGPYRLPTYSQVADTSRISIEDQAREYALWLMKNDRHHCRIYPLRKSSLAISNRFREALVGFHRGRLRFREVNPDDYLGKLTDRDREMDA